MTRNLTKASILVAVLLVVVTHGKRDSGFYQRLMKKTATAPSPNGNGKSDQKYVFQTPHFGGIYGHGGYGGIGGYGSFGHMYPVPVTGVKALSVAYDPVSGMPYVCDPTKKDEGGTGAGAGGAGAPGTTTPAPSPTTVGKRSDTEQKDEVKVKVPDYPPCPDPKKTFPWSCLLGGANSGKRECTKVTQAAAEASRWRWPYRGWLPSYYPIAYPMPFVGPTGGYGINKVN